MVIINNKSYANCSCPHGENIMFFDNKQFYCIDKIQCCDENNENCISLTKSEVNQLENKSQNFNNKKNTLSNHVNGKSFNSPIASKNQDNLLETNNSKITQSTTTKVPPNNIDNKNTKINNNKSSNGSTLKNSNKIPPISSNLSNSNNTESINSNNSVIPTIPDEGISSNSNNVIDNNKNLNPYENESYKNGVKDSSYFLNILTIGFTVLGMALTVFFIIKKYKKRNNNEELQEMEYEEDFKYPHSLLKDELKDPTESCEEYLNSLSRLRYKDPTYESYNPNKPYQQFSYFKESPILAPSIVHSIENISQTDLQPIMIDPQFENSNLSSIQIDRSYSAKPSNKNLCRKTNRDSNYSLKKMDVSSLKIPSCSDYSPLLKNDSFLSSPVTPNGDISMNLSIVNLSYNPELQKDNSPIEETEEEHQY